MTRLAIIVSHPIQYYVPLYRRLAARSDLQTRIFFTWHANPAGQHDPGFGRNIQWDVPLTDGYDFEVIPNTAAKPGTHHFWGIKNPALMQRLLAWQPDCVHITGYAYHSHLTAIRKTAARHLPLLFRGDSHLLNQRTDFKWWLKKALLRRIYGWVTAFPYVGRANRDYYRAFGVPEAKLFHCPHSIDVAHFAAGHDQHEEQARQWRKQLRIPSDSRVLLFAGKLEPKKRPVHAIDAFLAAELPRTVFVVVGDGVLKPQVLARVQRNPARVISIPFQNQSRMPVVYRLADVFTLPSAFGETWGLAVNEAQACGRPVLVSNRVGCAADLVTSDTGSIFPADDWTAFRSALSFELGFERSRETIQQLSRASDVSVTESTLVAGLKNVLNG